MAFHHTRFPLDIALGARGGPERRTEVTTLAGGGEKRNGRWAHSRRRYNAGYGVKSRADMQAVQGASCWRRWPSCSCARGSRRISGGREGTCTALLAGRYLGRKDMPMARRVFTVFARWDDDARLYYSESDIVGLHIEAENLDEFETLLFEFGPELILANHIPADQRGAMRDQDLIPAIVWRRPEERAA